MNEFFSQFSQSAGSSGETNQQIPTEENEDCTSLNECRSVHSKSSQPDSKSTNHYILKQLKDVSQKNYVVHSLFNTYNGNLIYNGTVDTNFKPHGKKCVLYNLLGNIEYEGSIIHGVKQGYGYLYNLNGKLKYKGQFKQGGPHNDTAILYNQNGQIEFKGIIKNGKKTGFGTLFWENGTLQYQGKFINDDIEGEKCTIFNDNGGHILYQGKMVKGMYEGHGVLFHENGTVMYEGDFNKNKMQSPLTEITIKHDNDKVEYEGFINNGLYEGYGKLYKRNGKLWRTGNFTEGKQNGKNCVIYYPNGLMHYQGEMKMGRVYGFGRYYCSKSGKLKSYGEHNFGLFKSSKLRIGLHPNGQIKHFGSFNSANELIKSNRFEFYKDGCYVNHQKKNYHKGSVDEEALAVSQQLKKAHKKFM